MNNNNRGNVNGQHNPSSSPRSIDIQNLENEPELPRAEPRSAGTLVAPGPGVSGPVPSLATFTTADAAGTATFTLPIAAPSSEPSNGAGTVETPTPEPRVPFSIDDAAFDTDVNPALAAREEQRRLEEYVRDMNNLGPWALPPGAAIVPPSAAPPFGIGLFAPAVTAGTTAQPLTVAATATAVNSGSAAPPAPTSSTAPAAAPTPIAASPGSSGLNDPGSAGHGRRHSHGGAAFDENGQLRYRPDDSLYLEHTPPSTESPSPPPPTIAADPTATAADPPPPPVATPSPPHIAASPPRLPEVSITPPNPMPAQSTGNTPEPIDPTLTEFFDFGAATE